MHLKIDIGSVWLSHLPAWIQVVVSVYDSKQESTIRRILQVSVHDRFAIVWLKDLAIFVRVAVWRATARAVHLEGLSPLLLEQVALSRQQVELFENFNVNGRPDKFGDIEAFLDVLLALVVVLDGVLAHAALEVFNQNRLAVSQIETRQPGQT